MVEISDFVGEDFFKEVRQDVVNEVAVVPRRYEEFLGGLEGVIAWVARMEKDGCWGDGVAIRAACNEYARPVVVFRKGSTQPPSAFIPETPGTETNAPIYLQLDETGGEGTQHYNPLILGSRGSDAELTAERKEDADMVSAEDAEKSAKSTITPPPIEIKKRARETDDELVTPPPKKLESYEKRTKTIHLTSRWL